MSTRKSRAAAKNKAADARAKKTVKRAGGSASKAERAATKTIVHNVGAVKLLKQGAEVGLASKKQAARAAATLKKQKATRSAIRAARRKK
jgi:DUF917 family protein